MGYFSSLPCSSIHQLQSFCLPFLSSLTVFQHELFIFPFLPLRRHSLSALYLRNVRKIYPRQQKKNNYFHHTTSIVKERNTEMEKKKAKIFPIFVQENKLYQHTDSLSLSSSSTFNVADIFLFFHLLSSLYIISLSAKIQTSSSSHR